MGFSVARGETKGDVRLPSLQHRIELTRGREEKTAQRNRSAIMKKEKRKTWHVARTTM